VIANALTNALHHFSLGSIAQIVGRRKSVHVRNALKATAGKQGVIRRDGPIAAIKSTFKRRDKLVA
jgi:hypothetical protein